MKYLHRFEVKASLAVVADFHTRSASMGDITSPPVVVRVQRAPERLQEGDEMEFTLWLGPLPVNWLARVEEFSATGFADRQLRGPFRHWTHRHRFLPIDETRTIVVDEVELSLRPDPLWGLFGLGLWLSLPLLFAYRAWKTRQLIEDRYGLAIPC
jgi:ligand-binding SRPBCC domain-containing protein